MRISDWSSDVCSSDLMRSSTQQVRNLDYVAAAEAAGCSTRRILLTEILPNVANNLIVVATLEMAHAILLEAALSFLGLGVQPPLPSWGLMISEGRSEEHTSELQSLMRSSYAVFCL